MNLRWLIGNFTEHDYGLSLRDQMRVSNEAHARFISRKAFWLRTALILLPLIVYFALLKRGLALLGYQGQTGPHLIALGLAVVLFWPWSAWMYRSLYIGPVRRVMRDMGYNLCIACGYDLRGLDESTTRCPECGAEPNDMPRNPPRPVPPVFGQRQPGAHYQPRPSAYAIVTDGQGRVAVLCAAASDGRKAHHLPGGGIEPGESAEAALVREVREECGIAIQAQRTSLEAVQYVFAPGEGHFEKRCIYFRGAFIGIAQPGDEHELLWLDLADAVRALDHESHRWAVTQLLGTAPIRV